MAPNVALGEEQPDPPTEAAPPAVKDAPIPDARSAPGAGAPADDVEAAMRKSFAELADSDADVRESARAALMGVQRRYLPALRRLVAQNRPLMPSQAVVLRQIVTHVYLAGEPYDAIDDSGFIGVKMHETAVRAHLAEKRLVLPPDADADADELMLRPLPQVGVVVTERLAGFVGNRLLLDSDVIVGIAERPEAQFGSSSAFGAVVRETPPGRPLHLHVLRRGRLMKIAVPLDARPDAAQPDNPAAIDHFDQRRREKADTYWRESFAPLLREGVG